MIVVSGTFDADPDRHDDVVDLAASMRADTLTEPGCRAYSFWTDPVRRGRYHVFEEWDDQAALDAHAETEHFAAFVAAMPTLGIGNAEIWQYDASDAQRTL